MINYLLLLCTAVLGAFNLLKDWDKHGTNTRRYAVLFLIIGVAVLGTVSLAINDRKATREKRDAADKAATYEKIQRENADEIVRLKQAVESSQKAQEINSRSFLDQLAKLYTKAESEHLRAEIKSSQDRILKSVQADPPAHLIGSFDGDMSEAPILRKAYALEAGGAVSPELVALNDSNKTAREGECIVRICKACKYASEPERMNRITGAPDTDRTRTFQFVVAGSSVGIPLRVIPPAGEHEFEVRLLCGCTNCANHIDTKFRVEVKR